MLSDANERSFNMIGTFTSEIRNHLTSLILNFEPAVKFFGGVLSQTSLSIKKSPIVDEFLGLPIHLDQSKHINWHDQCFTSWIEFGRGPSAGDRAPDIEGLEDQSSKRRWLFDNLLNGKHGLLIFLGCDDYHQIVFENVNQLLKSLNQGYDGWINPVVISQSNEVPEQIDSKVRVIYDKRRLAHKRYGAQGPCLYLIRPDRFIGFRSMPPSWNKLSEYLSQKLLLKGK